MNIATFFHTSSCTFFQIYKCISKKPSFLGQPHQSSFHRSSCTGKKEVYMKKRKESFPPKCGHKTQLLDVALYGPFKRFYASFCDSWWTSHPRTTISSYEIAEISGKAYESAFTTKNITAGFITTGIYPFNPPHVFGRWISGVPLLENAADETDPDISSVSLDVSILHHFNHKPAVLASFYNKAESSKADCVKKRFNKQQWEQNWNLFSFWFIWCFWFWSLGYNWWCKSPR